MKISDYIKDGKVDINKILKADGTLDIEALDFIESEKPIFPVGANTPAVKINRDRMVDFPSRLPTSGINPFPTDENNMIGQYETKQNIYLTAAHAYNKVMELIEDLEKRIYDLENP